MEITKSGKYALSDNIYGNIDIIAEDVELDGNYNTVYGWVHVGKGNSVVLKNMVVEQISTIKIDGMCSICGIPLPDKKGENMVFIHSRKDVTIDNICLNVHDQLQCLTKVSGCKDFEYEGVKCPENCIITSKHDIITL